MGMVERRVGALYTYVPVLECECASMRFVFRVDRKHSSSYHLPSGVAQLVCVQQLASNYVVR
jgi:hypothetical protein